jgi:HPt (histidine-containing phosphotransfer) domain-containing protein
MEEEEKDHFDKKEFLEYILNNIELYNELIVITKETLPKGKTDLLAAYAAKDITGIKEVAHMLKGHSMTMFFRTLHKISLSIELSAINNDYEGISREIGNIEKEIDCLIDNYLN